MGAEPMAPVMVPDSTLPEVASCMVIFCWPIGELTVTSQVPSTADMALAFLGWRWRDITRVADGFKAVAGEVRKRGAEKSVTVYLFAPRRRSAHQRTSN